jgi:uncharacterized protein (DUF58 family)
MSRQPDSTSQTTFALQQHSTVLLKRRSLHFTGAGWTYVGMMLFMGIAAINTQANLLFAVFGLMIGVLLISGVISRLVIRRLTLDRSLPDHACVGDAITVGYQITNGKRFWPSLSVVLAELDGVEAFTKQPQTFLLHAAPKMTATVPTLLIPKRRGLHKLDRYQLITSFPFGFVKRAITGRKSDVLLVYPPIAQVSSKLLEMCQSADTSGEVSHPQPGGADEFYGVREYRAGDNPRLIYWKRSAKSGTLVSREMTRVSPPRIVLLVDTLVASRTLEAHAMVERCVAMAASLAASALDQGLSVGVCVWNGKWNTIRPTRGKRHKSDLLSLLAQLPLNDSHLPEAMMAHARPLLAGGSTAVVFTSHEPQGTSPNFSRGHLLTIAADSSRAQSWFKFDDKTDFMSAMPPDQATGILGSAVIGGRQ